MRRRILAITLLIAFGFPLLAPAFTATSDADSQLPACCRSHGAHHCVMTHLRQTSGGPAITPPLCPFYPTPSTAPRTAASLATAHPRSTVLLRVAALVAATPRRTLRASVSSANLKRGPPTLLA